MNQIAWRADPLVWGHGPRVFEVFLEPTCPFSVRAFGKLDDLLAQAGEDRITIKIRLQSQPWHMYSGVIMRCILAASTLDGRQGSGEIGHGGGGRASRGIRVRAPLPRRQHGRHAQRHHRADRSATAA